MDGYTASNGADSASDPLVLMAQYLICLAIKHPPRPLHPPLLLSSPPLQAVLSITSVVGCDGLTPLVGQRLDEEPGSLYAKQIFINHDYSVKVLHFAVSNVG